MGYFRELPNVEYESPFSSRTSSSTFILAKNIFRRMKIRDDLQNVFTLFDKYEIREGARPDTVAEELYGKADYDWVVLISANIINIREQWPLSNKDLYDYTVSKYGLENINDAHHHETKLVKNSKGNIIVQSGKQVDSDFSVTYYDPDVSSTPITKTEITRAISNYDYETMVNEEKATIYLLKPSYLQQFLNDMRNEMVYKESSQFVDNKLIKTENTRAK